MQRRLIDLGEEIILIRAVGARRIEVLWRLKKSGIEDIAATLRRAVRVIGRAAGQQRKSKKRKGQEGSVGSVTDSSSPCNHGI
ncbi:MAG: hypothetical protein A2054_00375 [Deltaproteobacteria bacterium GWA2_55_10]|nr:MAG: hypothetical protein A2054_00375 [Deltaproteobacteria bacterium GWA2_55_10]